MSKSLKASRKRKPRTFGQALAAAERKRKRKPSKALVELMRHTPQSICRPPVGAISAQNENDRLVEAHIGTKPSNPKDVLGVLKVPRSTVSAPVMAEVGLGMLEGAMKYGRHNYRAIGVRGSVYYDAACRHLDAWWEGEDYDLESFVGLHHISKAIASLTVLRDAMIQNKFVDDRPPKSKTGWMNELNDKVKALREKYTNPVAPYIEGDERMK